MEFASSRHVDLELWTMINFSDKKVNDEYENRQALISQPVDKSTLCVLKVPPNVDQLLWPTNVV